MITSEKTDLPVAVAVRGALEFDGAPVVAIARYRDLQGMPQSDTSERA